jgi:hypothetical protein
MSRRRWRRRLGRRRRGTGGRGSRGLCRSSSWRCVLGDGCVDIRVSNLRGKNKRLADELALGVLGDRNSVTACAGGAADKGTLRR